MKTPVSKPMILCSARSFFSRLPFATIPSPPRGAPLGTVLRARPCLRAQPSSKLHEVLRSGMQDHHSVSVIEDDLVSLLDPQDVAGLLRYNQLILRANRCGVHLLHLLMNTITLEEIIICTTYGQYVK